MFKMQFGIIVANSVVIDIANDVILVGWMEVYPFRVDQSKSLLYAEIKWLYNPSPILSICVGAGGIVKEHIIFF